jgi:hypothetical protein
MYGPMSPKMMWQMQSSNTFNTGILDNTYCFGEYMILLWGLPSDNPLMRVLNALFRSKHAVVFVDQRLVLESEIELCVANDVEGMVRTRNQVVDLGSITAAYLRPYDSLRLSVIESAGWGSPAWQHALKFDDTLLSWSELTSALVVNRPTAMATNNSKPYQTIIIRSLGFDTPDTLITTDPATALEFQVQHGKIIYKSISGIRSIVSHFTSEQMGRLENVKWCPTQFQEYIPGNDYRVHVVGEEIFACEIISAADDYRYATRQGSSVEIRPYELPMDIADRCKSLVMAMGLSVAGVDLRRRPDSRWYCFEVNPSPAFTYYQDATAQPIDEAIARLLTVGVCSSALI